VLRVFGENLRNVLSRSFSEAGMAEICHLHERLMSNLRLGMSVFLDGHESDAQSIETSSLHLDLTSELERINSHICSIAYPILESAGVLAKTRLRQAELAGLSADELRA
jgi:phosphate:Na+ symporter